MEPLYSQIAIKDFPRRAVIDGSGTKSNFNWQKAVALYNELVRNNIF